MKRLTSIVWPFVKSVASQPTHITPFLSTLPSVNSFSHTLISNHLRQYSTSPKTPLSSSVEEQEKLPGLPEQTTHSIKSESPITTTSDNPIDIPIFKEGSEIYNKLEGAQKPFYDDFMQSLYSYYGYIPESWKQPFWIGVAALCVGYRYREKIGLQPLGWWQALQSQKKEGVTAHRTQWRERQHVIQPVDYYLPNHWLSELKARLTLVKTTVSRGKPSCLAITGTPGSGKSELANYFAMQYLDSLHILAGLHKAGLSIMPIVWTLNAETPDILWHSYKDLAKHLKLNTARASDEDSFTHQARLCQEVKHALKAQPGWVLIFANAEKRAHIKDYIPHHGHGIVLVTSQHTEFFYEKQCNLNISQGLLPEEAVQLLQHLAGIDDAQQAGSLANTLEYLPHYLVVAALTLKTHNEQHPQQPWTYATYAEHLQQLPSKQQAQQQQLIGQQLPYSDIQQAVIELALTKLNNPQASELIGVCSLLHADNIPRYLLKQYIQQLQPGLATAAVDVYLDKLMTAIQQTGLLQYQPQQESYRIHRVTQSVIQTASPPSAVAIEHLLNSLLASFPLDDNCPPDNMARYRELLPHCTALLQTTAITLPIALAGTLLSKTGNAYWRLGHPEVAQTLLSRALPLLEAAYGREHVQVGKTLTYLAVAYRDLEDTRQVKIAYERALPILEAHYGKEHREVAIALTNLAAAYFDLADSPRAKIAYERALPIMEACYGEKHPFVGVINHKLQQLEQQSQIENKQGELIGSFLAELKS